MHAPGVCSIGLSDEYSYIPATRPYSTTYIPHILQVRILNDSSFGRPAKAAQPHPEQASPGGLVDAMRVMGTSTSQCGTSYYMAPEVHAHLPKHEHGRERMHVHGRGASARVVRLHPPSPLTPHLPRLAVRDLPLESIGHLYTCACTLRSTPRQNKQHLTFNL